MAKDRASASMRIVTGLLALLLSSAASAADYYLEGPPQETRSAAVGLSRSISDDGYKARVVRRYRQGVGWRYLLRVDGFDAEEPAREAARAIAGRIGLPVSVYAAEGGTARTVELATPGEAPVEEAAPADPIDADTTDAEAILRRASRAHGGAKGGLAAIRAADAVVFQFRRTLPDGLVVDHTWARRGKDRYVEITVVEGEGRSSRMLVREDEAWLAVDGGGYEPTDTGRAADVVAGLHPEQVVPFVLVFADAIENRRELELLQLTGKVDVEGKPAVSLRYDGDRTSGPMTLALDSGRSLVLEVSFEDGELVHRFDGWRQGAGLPVPGRVRTWRGGELVDTVEIRELSIQATPPKEWFEPR